MRYTFKRTEKLKSKKLIEQLFENGKKINAFPILLVYQQINHQSNYKIQAGFTVSKRNFKRAVDRNRIKRLMRESFRIQKHLVQELQEDKGNDKAVFMFIYLGKDELPYTTIETAMLKLIKSYKKIAIKE